jgi:predicted dehydrogenase
MSESLTPGEGGDMMAQPLTAVLVGCGGISRVWLDAIVQIPDLKMVGLVDLLEEAARTRAGEYGLEDVLVGTDLAVVLGELKPDLVFDCTVPEAHVHVTLAALGRGCHVLGEKPLADTMANAKKMIAAAEQAGRVYAVMQNRRYDPNILRLRQFLESGEIGSATTVHCDSFIGAHFDGFRSRMAHVLLVDMAIHTFDQARFLTGADPVSVYCKEWNPPGSWYDRDASAIAIFEMSDGIVYSYRGSWCAEGLNTAWESEWRIIGERGSVTWNGEDAFQAQVVEETGGLQSKCRDVGLPPYGGAGKPSGHDGLIRDFVHCIRTGTVPETICTDNVKSLAMVFGAVESAESGKRVAISL